MLNYLVLTENTGLLKAKLLGNGLYRQTQRNVALRVRMGKSLPKKGVYRWFPFHIGPPLHTGIEFVLNLRPLCANLVNLTTWVI